MKIISILVILISLVALLLSSCSPTISPTASPLTNTNSSMTTSTSVTGTSTSANATVTSETPVTSVQSGLMTFPPPSLDVNAVTDKSFYLTGEKVDVKFTVTNITGEELTINNFPPYTDIASYSEARTVRKFEKGDRSVNLNPGESLNYEIVWDQMDDTGNPVNIGYYYITSVFPTFNIISSSLKEEEYYHSIFSYPIVIRFPQGNMQKTITVNQSQTGNGVTITLERVELSERGMEIYTIKTPPIAGGPGPSYYIAGGTVFQGTYRIDDGPVMNIGSPGYFAEEDGVKYTWGFPPVPADAKMLYFSISSISIPASVDGVPVVAGSGDYGPFNFEIPLQ